MLFHQGENRGLLFFVYPDHWLHQFIVRVNDVITEYDRERFVLDKRLGAQNSMPEPKRSGYGV